MGIVLVSHSAELVSGLRALLAELAPPEVPVVGAGGTDDGRIGTSYRLVLDAVRQADAGGGVVVLADLGSSVLTARTVLEDEELTQARLVDAPFVEEPSRPSSPRRRAPPCPRWPAPRRTPGPSPSSRTEPLPGQRLPAPVPTRPAAPALFPHSPVRPTTPRRASGQDRSAGNTRTAAFGPHQPRLRPEGAAGAAPERTMPPGPQHGPAGRPAAGRPRPGPACSVRRAGRGGGHGRERPGPAWGAGPSAAGLLMAPGWGRGTGARPGPTG
ncbi:hypothetical protein ACFQZC_07755 [Streptacidiphilus monticola]